MMKLDRPTTFVDLRNSKATGFVKYAPELIESFLERLIQGNGVGEDAPVASEMLHPAIFDLSRTIIRIKWI